MNQRSLWFGPAVTLCILWFIMTCVTVALAIYVTPLRGFVGKTAPFVVAGFITGRRFPELTRGPKLVAAAVLTLTAAIAWTLFSFATGALSGDRIAVLVVGSLPVMMIGGAWAYLGMYLGARRDDGPTKADATETARGSEDLERSLREELERDIAAEQPHK